MLWLERKKDRKEKKRRREELTTHLIPVNGGYFFFFFFSYFVGKLLPLLFTKWWNDKHTAVDPSTGKPLLLAPSIALHYLVFQVTGVDVDHFIHTYIHLWGIRSNMPHNVLANCPSFICGMLQLSCLFIFFFFDDFSFYLYLSMKNTYLHL